MPRDALNVILSIQELDIQMIRLMRLKREREHEQERVSLLREDLRQKVLHKEHEIIELKKQIRLVELEIAETTAKIEKLEQQQNQVRKIEDFNALGHEITSNTRARTAKEHVLADLFEKQAADEETLKKLRATYDAAIVSGQEVEEEIGKSVLAINEEGAQLLKQRRSLEGGASPDLLSVYEKLLKNKRDRVIVPIENRCCSGCHILVTAQHENMVRKGDKLVFCEHCSRIHYWSDSGVVGGERETVTPRRRRRSATKT